MVPTSASPLSAEIIDRFVVDGFVRVQRAFDPALAELGRRILWADMGLDPGDPSTWRQPAVRLVPSDDGPFRDAVNTPVLHEAFDQLLGPGRWYPRPNAGAFVVRFPTEAAPDDTGWHVEGSFLVEGETEHRLNLRSRDRGLLLLMLFSDVGEADGPTQIRVGSHLDVPTHLSDAGDAGVLFSEFAPIADQASSTRHVEYATGNAGDVYLCHPFIVHAAQAHHGATPRFMAQPGLMLREALALSGNASGDHSPVEQAVRLGLSRAVQSPL